MLDGDVRSREYVSEFFDHILMIGGAFGDPLAVGVGCSTVRHIVNNRERYVGESPEPAESP